MIPREIEEKLLNEKCEHSVDLGGIEFLWCLLCVKKLTGQARSEGVDEGLEKGAKVAENRGRTSHSYDGLIIAKEILALKTK